jgi:hypothetical protein
MNDNANVVIDSRAVLRMFASLDSKRQAKVHKSALQKSAAILVRETKKNLKSVVKDSNSKGWHTRNNPKGKAKTLSSGVRTTFKNDEGKRDTTQVKVHIMRDFRLKWFEMGTKPRFRSKKKVEKVRRRAGGREYWKRDYGNKGPISTGQDSGGLLFPSCAGFERA